MATLTQHPSTVEYLEKLRQAFQRDTALRQMAERARTRYAGEAARIDRGLVIALNGGVTLHQDGTASVQSSSNAEVVYHVAHGTCDCPDFSRAPEGRCKHRFSVCLVKKAQQHVAEEQAAQTYYATYYAEHATYQGTAQYLPAQGWVFRSDEDDFTLAYADCGNLVLGGNVALLEAQRAADGNLAAKVCGYAN